MSKQEASESFDKKNIYKKIKKQVYLKIFNMKDDKRKQTVMFCSILK